METRLRKLIENGWMRDLLPSEICEEARKEGFIVNTLTVLNHCMDLEEELMAMMLGESE